jgi:hypothetical protein
MRSTRSIWLMNGATVSSAGSLGRPVHAKPGNELAPPHAEAPAFDLGQPSAIVAARKWHYIARLAFSSQQPYSGGSIESGPRLRASVFLACIMK